MRVKLKSGVLEYRFRRLKDPPLASLVTVNIYGATLRRFSPKSSLEDTRPFIRLHQGKKQFFHSSRIKREKWVSASVGKTLQRRKGRLRDNQNRPTMIENEQYWGKKVDCSERQGVARDMPVILTFLPVVNDHTFWDWAVSRCHNIMMDGILR